jgi:restriction system protein
MNVITKDMPNDWGDLQRQVSQILQERGLETDLERSIKTARGTVEVDVYAEDRMQTPYVTYLCECKHWTSSVPQTIIHAFRTVVTDYGATI